MSVPSRALLVALSLVLGMTALSIAPELGSAHAASASARSLWVARPAHILRIESAGTARTSAGAVTLRALRSGRASVWRRGRFAPAGDVGTTWVATSSVRGRHPGQRVALVVVEHAAGRAVQKRRAVGRIHRGRTLHLRLTITRRVPGSRFALGLVARRVYRGQTLRLSHVTLRSATQAKPGKTSPTPAPGPTPTAGLPLSNGCTYSARGLPSCGTYLGAAHGSNTDPAVLEAATGGRLGIRRTYWTASQVSSAVSVARNDLAHGRLPWISFKLPYAWADMATGAGDAWARDIATRLSALPGPVWVAFHHEPEGDGDITTWRTIQERLAPIVRATAPNVGYTVILTGWNELYGSSSYSLDNIWPRNVKIDVAGFDIYNQYGVVKNGVMNTKGTDLKTAYFDKIAPWAAAHDVAWGLGETGYTDPASEVDPDWIKRTYGEMTALGGVAFGYFDTTLNSVANWALSTDTKLQAYARARSGAPVLPPLS